MNKQEMQELKEIIQSSHINFLFGAGASTPFLPLLGDIETRLSEEKKSDERIKIKKEYFNGVMAPNLDVVNGNIEKAKQSDFDQTKSNYKNLFEVVAHILLKRKNTILSKQANVFTTNIDVLMEAALEESKLEYNDGFSGRLDSGFSLSNLKKSLLKRSLHFENISEVPMFNLMKIHGSLTWKKEADRIAFSKLAHFDKSLADKEGEEFEEIYKQLAIVNPEKKKFEETVIDLHYYELLRMYSSELEKENAVLFVIGFSMEDEHIREITIRAADSNPTLKIFVFSYSKDGAATMREKLKLKERRYSNIEVVEPTDDEESSRLDLSKVTESIFREILKSIAYDGERKD